MFNTMIRSTITMWWILLKVESELVQLEELKIDLASTDGRIEKLEKAASLAISVDLRDFESVFGESQIVLPYWWLHMCT